jgi:hypothetical protein
MRTKLGRAPSASTTRGSARVLLSPDVRPRTSVFFGDSLSWIRNSTGAPAPLNEADELTWPFDRGVPTERGSLDEGAFDEVVELQIIGGISVGVGDIDGVIFDFEPPAVVARALRCAGIDWSVNPMPTFPAWLGELFVRDRLGSAEESADSGTE